MDLLGDYEDSGDEKETQLPVGPAPVGPAIPTEEDLASLDQLLHNHEIHKTTHEIKRDKEEVEKKPSRPPPPGMKRKREMDTGTELKQRLEKPARIEVAGLNLKDKKMLSELEAAEFVSISASEVLSTVDDKDEPSLSAVLLGEAKQGLLQKFGGQRGQPSKLQKQRHQINAMAIDAAKRELDILDKRYKGQATRSQTRAKYGW